MSQKPLVVLGVTGGIACYKAADLVRKIIDLGTEVHCVMTQNATRFVTPLTFQVLTRNPVHVDPFEPVTSWNVAHVALAERACLVVICPATANIIGKIASGIADDLLTTVVMAAANETEILLCPAMNQRMWENPIVQENIERLKDLQYRFVEPEEGAMACDEHGKGRLAAQERILEAIRSLLF